MVRTNATTKDGTVLYGLIHNMWSQNQYVFMKNDNNRLRSFAAGYHSFTFRPNFDIFSSLSASPLYLNHKSCSYSDMLI